MFDRCPFCGSHADQPKEDTREEDELDSFLGQMADILSCARAKLREKKEPQVSRNRTDDFIRHDPYVKYIRLRVGTKKFVSIPYDLEKEAIQRENLIANGILKHSVTTDDSIER